jgi:hypothetical protein
LQERESGEQPPSAARVAVAAAEVVVRLHADAALSTTM